MNAASPTEPIALINARLIDPETAHDDFGGVLIKDGFIADLGPHLRRNAPKGASVIDCGGHILCPGLIDMLAFVGEPGYAHRENLQTASRAAAAGGVTTIICTPNTNPVIDDVSLVDFIERRSRDIGIVNIHPMAAITAGLAGEQMTEIGLLIEAGAVAFTDGVKSIQNAHVMRQVLSYGKDYDALIAHFAEDANLRGVGVMNEGDVSARLGLSGAPATAETIILDRDMRLVALTGGRYHAILLSTAEGTDIIRKAKSEGLRVTAGASINNLTLNENDIGPYRTFFKLTPPLRREEDRASLVQALRDGTIDVICSAHDPQDADGKRRPFAEAADGAIGIETLLSAALRLHHTEDVSLPTLLAAMTINPAKLLNLPSGRLQEQRPADLTLFDLNTPWIVDPNQLHSRSKNTPFDEARLQGRVLRTFVAGKQVYQYKQNNI